MEIFKRKFNKPSKSPPDNFIGLFVNDEIDVVMRVVTLANGQTKSKVIADLLQGWISKQNWKNAITTLVEIAREYYYYWVKEPGKKGRGTHEFLKNVTSELHRAGISSLYINDIVTQLKTIINEEDTSRTRKKV